MTFVNNLFSKLAGVSPLLFYAAIFLLPLWTLPYTIFPLELNKSYLAYFLIILSALLYLGFVLKMGRLVLPKNLAYLLLLAFLISFAISALGSEARPLVFSGLGQEPSTFFALLLFALVFFLASVFLSAAQTALRGILMLSGSFVLLFIFQFFQSVLKISLVPWLGQVPTVNLFGGWNELGIFSGLVLLLSLTAFNFFPSRSFLKLFFLLLIVLSFLTAGLVNFSLVWWLVAIFLVIFLAHLYSRRKGSRLFFKAPLLVLILVLVFILARPLTSELLSFLGIQFVEVRPSWSASWEVLGASLKENPAFGSGPNTFGNLWLKYRPADIAQTPFWQVRFSSGAGFLPSWLATSGIVGGILFLGFLGLFLWQGFLTLTREDEEASFLELATFFGAVYLWAAALLYAVGFLLVFFAFLFTGAFLGQTLSRRGGASLTFSLLERPGAGFFSALVLIFLAVVLVSWFYVLAQKYYAGIVYGQGVRFFNLGDFNEAERKLLRALSFERQDRYLRTLTDLHLVRLGEIVSRRDLAPEEARAQFQDVLGKAIQNAQAATDLHPDEYLNWLNLGRIYEAIVPFGVQGAAEFAKNSYAEALKYFPSNPEAYLAQARVELFQNKREAAKAFLLKAVEIKSDWAPAHFLLAQLEAQSGNLPEAVRRAETATRLAPDDLGVLFQLGLLYYQARNYDGARAVLERAVASNPNYSNARYFLGLIYDQAGEKARALLEFERILALNPDNNEVRQIIQNLREGRGALYKISPPEPPPEKRKTTPVPERNGNF